MVGTTTINMAVLVATGQAVLCGRRILRVVITPPTSPRTEVTIGSVHTSVMYQPIKPVVGSPPKEQYAAKNSMYVTQNEVKLGLHTRLGSSSAVPWTSSIDLC